MFQPINIKCHFETIAVYINAQRLSNRRPVSEREPRGRAKSVQRFERSDGLDTALYKNYLYFLEDEKVTKYRCVLTSLRLAMPRLPSRSDSLMSDSSSTCNRFATELIAAIHSSLSTAEEL